MKKQATSKNIARTNSKTVATKKTNSNGVAKSAAGPPSMLDRLSSPVTVTDVNFTLAYANNSAKQMFAANADQFRQLWPGFDPDKLKGTKIHLWQANAAPSVVPTNFDLLAGNRCFSISVSAAQGARNYVLEWFDVTETRRREALSVDYAGQIAAIGKSNAVIEFSLDGTILTANDNFLDALGYTLDEIKGKHHSMFVDDAYKRSNEYRDFWANLNRGEYQSGEYKRLGRGGREVWIQASYNPIFDANAKPFKVVKYATDITPAKLKNSDYEGQIAAIKRTMAVIEFNLDGTILWANDHFLAATGYTLEEVKGRHHSIFVEEAYRSSEDYRGFWARLNRGEADSRQYKRIRRNGSELWLQASYNPIFDLNGKPFKVIKYATDITENKKKEDQLARAMGEVGRVMHAVARGNLGETMEGAFDGEFAVLRDTVNTCVDSLRRMMAETGKVMKAVASGDLRDSIQGTFEGSFGELSEAVNISVQRLRETVEQIRNAMSTMTVSASEIASGNLDLSHRTEEQASSLTTTAANDGRTNANRKT